MVIEIGPGLGSLTQVLADNAGKVLAIEIDKTLIPILSDTLSGYDNVEIINNDVLKIDINSLIKEQGYEKASIVANLPYYITTPIIMGILESGTNINSMTVMVQKEVGDRMRATPSTKDYGSLSLAVQFYADVELIANVPRNCFIPRPNVDSAVVKLSIRQNKEFDVYNEKLMFKIIRAAFEQRRKTLLNCIYNLCGFGYSKDELSEILTSCGFDVNVRGESLSLQDFVKISNVFCNSSPERCNSSSE